MTNSADSDQLASSDPHCLQRQGISGFSMTRVKYLGLVVQSIVSLTSLLMTNSLTVLAKVFFVEKNVSSFCIAKNINVFNIFQA